jgi:hypothetical protein
MYREKTMFLSFATALLFIVMGFSQGKADEKMLVPGTVLSISNSNISLKKSDGKLMSYKLDRNTKFSHENNAITIKDIKVGDSVIVVLTVDNNKKKHIEIIKGEASFGLQGITIK